MKDFFKDKIPTEKLLTTQAAALISGVTPQAIHLAVKKNMLKASKKGRHWLIKYKDLQEYHANKYSRLKKVVDGELLFDEKKGFYTIHQVAKILEVDSQRIYYAARCGYLKTHRHGATWVIHIEDMDKFKREQKERFNKPSYLTDVAINNSQEYLCSSCLKKVKRVEI